MAAEYFSFEDVLGELDVGEEELKRMVSEGELRAFRDENKMKFRKEDVENLRKGRTTEPTLILPAQDEGGGTGDTILDLDGGVQELGTDDAGPAVDLPGAPAKVGKGGRPASETQDVTEQLDFSDTDVTIADDSPPSDLGPSETAADSDETGLSTEPLQLVEEGATEPLPAEEAAPGEEAAPEEAAPRKARRRRTAAIPLEVEEEIERRRPHWIWSVFLVMTFISALYSGFFVFDLLRIQAGRAEKPTPITEGLTRQISETFYGDEQWRREFKFEGHSPNTVPDIFKHKAAYTYTMDEMEAATRGIPIEGPDGSMRPGSGTPVEAPPSDQKPVEGKKEGAPAAPAGEAPPAAGGGGEAKPAAGDGGTTTKPPEAPAEGGGPAVPGMDKAGEK